MIKGQKDSRYIIRTDPVLIELSRFLQDFEADQHCTPSEQSDDTPKAAVVRNKHKSEKDEYSKSNKFLIQVSGG